MIELAQFCGGVTPGISTVEYLPTAWVDRDVYVKLIDSAHNWQKEIITTQGDWMKAPLLPFGDLLNEVQKEGPSGPSWEVQVAGRTPKMLPTVTGTLARMARYRFLLRIQLREGGLPWIIGSLDAPLSFVYQAVVDEGKNSYDLRWSAPIPHSMYSYNPVIQGCPFVYGGQVRNCTHEITASYTARAMDGRSSRQGRDDANDTPYSEW